MIANKKYVIYAQIKPYDIKLSLVFSTDSRVRYMQEFIDDTMRNYKTKYKVGRIEHKKSSSILLPDYKIGEVLEDKDEIIVYSIEYGLTKKTLSDKSSIEDIDKLFIGKKLKRDSKLVSRKVSADKKETKKGEKDNDNDDNEEENNEEGEEDDDDEDNNNENEKNEKNKESKKESKKNNKKKKTQENSSSSGEDDSQDLKIT